ncbi:MAG: RluA family pseudouridine synthase [Alphaproteobacteria bacterium]|nr:RluA family pseudouridine synthase [Alphaproteobacteria bacterium]
MAGKGNPPGGPATRAVEVTPDQAGQRLDRVLADALGTSGEGLSRSRLKALIEDGHVTRNAAPARQPSAKVAAGDTLTVTIPAADDPEPIAQAMDLDILFEDEHLIVLDKPPGLVVHPAPGNPDRTLVNALIAHCGADFTGIGGVKRPGIVHRLDKDTSGVMVAAKTAAAHAGLVEQFAARTVERAYRAVVWGRPQPPAGTIEGDIGRHPKNRKKMAVVSRNGKPARTRYRTVATYGHGLAAQVECRLETGRTHQIRVHLTHAGYPLVGDPVYGRAGHRRSAAKALGSLDSPPLTGFPRQALHAYRLGFSHPVTGQNIDFSTNFPSDMENLVSFLESI